jgi:hypothetical protein
VSALSALLPTPTETLFLRACLQSGAPARTAWEEWSRRVEDPLDALRADGGSLRTLLPLLLDGLRRNAVPADPALLTHLRSAFLREELRSRAYRRICGGALSALAEQGIGAVVLRGAALAETVYTEPALRHCHDLDVLVGGGDVAAAARAVSRAGFGPARGGRAHVTLAHASGLPLVIHGRPFRISYYELPFEDVWARTETRSVGGVDARVLCPADHLVHVCGHASYSPSRTSLRWVCDAWSLIQHDTGVDWDLLLDSTARGRLALPVSIMLGYLADELRAPIPPGLLGELRDAAARTDAAGVNAALVGLADSPFRRALGFVRARWTRTQ